MCKVLGQAHLAGDKRYATNVQRALHRFDLKQDLESAFSRFDAQTLFEKLVSVGVPCDVIQNTLEALNHPHTAHRGMVAEVEGFRSVASPNKLSRTPASYRLPPARAIGLDTRQVLNEAGLSEQQITLLLERGVIQEASAVEFQA